MTVTIWGVAARERDVAATYLPRSGALDLAEAVDELVEELPDDGVGIDVGHGGERIGQLIFGEVDTTGQLNVVGIVNDPAIMKIASAIYLSPELIVLGRDVTRSRSVADVAPVGGLAGLALTTDPATPGLTPIRMRDGDLRDAGHRRLWPLSWRTNDPLLGRALDALGTRPRTTRLQRHAEQPPMNSWVDRHGRPVPGAWRHGPPSPILSVR